MAGKPAPAKRPVTSSTLTNKPSTSIRSKAPAAPRSEAASAGGGEEKKAHAVATLDQRRDLVLAKLKKAATEFINDKKSDLGVNYKSIQDAISPELREREAGPPVRSLCAMLSITLRFAYLVNDRATDKYTRTFKTARDEAFALMGETEREALEAAETAEKARQLTEKLRVSESSLQTTSSKVAQQAEQIQTLTTEKKSADQELATAKQTIEQMTREKDLTALATERASLSTKTAALEQQELIRRLNEEKKAAETRRDEASGLLSTAQATASRLTDQVSQLTDQLRLKDKELSEKIAKLEARLKEQAAEYESTIASKQRVINEQKRDAADLDSSRLDHTLNTTRLNTTRALNRSRSMDTSFFVGAGAAGTVFKPPMHARRGSAAVDERSTTQYYVARFKGYWSDECYEFVEKLKAFSSSPLISEFIGEFLLLYLNRHDSRTSSVIATALVAQSKYAELRSHGVITVFCKNPCLSESSQNKRLSRLAKLVDSELKVLIRQAYDAGFLPGGGACKALFNETSKAASAVPPSAPADSSPQTASAALSTSSTSGA